MLKHLFVAATLAAGLAGPASAACSFQNTVPLKTLSAAFEAWKAVTAAMAECGNVQSELDQEFRRKQPAAFAANPSLYQLGGVSNGTIVPLLSAGTIRPLDDLVAKYGQSLSPNQLIRIDGKIMAIAMSVNSQHLMYRQDIFAELGIPQPKTYDDVLAAAAKIKASGKVAYAMGATFKPGFDIGLDFVNLFLGFGGTLTKPDNTPAFNGEAGLKTLNAMKAISAFLDPEYLVSESTFVQKQFQQGKIAIAHLWATRAAAMDDAKESQVVGKIAMVASPAAMAGGKPASTLWWDGFAIAKNIPDSEAEAAFRVGVAALNENMVKANNGAAVWLIKGFTPARAAEGAIATAMAGAPPYPSTITMGIAMTAIGDNAADFLTGKKTAEQTLAAMEAAYLVKAREQGLVK